MSPCIPCSVSDENDTGILDLPEGTEIPVKNRKQTDKHYFIVLVLFFIFLVICVSVAGGQGDIRRLIHGYDDKGNICGYKNEPIKGVPGSGLDYTEQKYLQIREHCAPDIAYDCWTETRCVKRCEEGYDSSVMPLCVTKGDKSEIGTLKSFFEIVAMDLSLCWREIIVLCFFSICLSGLVLTLLRIFAKIVIWAILFLVSITGIGLTIFTWTIFGMNIASKEYSYNDLYNEERRMAEKREHLYLTAATVITLFTVLYLILLYRLRHKIKLVTALFEEGGKCIENVPMMLLQPVLTHLVAGLLACFMFVGLAVFETSGKPELDADGNVYFPTNVFFEIASWLLLFGFLWLSQFLLAFQNLVISGVACSWYFSRVKGKLVNPVWNSFKMIFKHHLGSAAFGSLILAIVKAIRMIFRMFESRQGLAFIIWKMIQCLLACVEAFLKILNKSAYVMIVLFGDPFCVSARKAFNCITADSSRIAIVIGVGTFILTVVELVITISVTFVGAALFMNIEGLETFWIPTCVVFILSILCCHSFFSVYEMTIDALILCFCVDHQMNHGLENPYYMNTNLMVYLEEDNASSTGKAINEDGKDNTALVVA